ncbi:MAG: N-acetyltransferase [Chitinophaga sp.]|uniref:GNAT family N-acetyltransferase n=1 Tax=Chitinophaga sp. TaxID=1869181 RepID=UPI001B2590D1|nr:N-acetyltransferase [Chitinophaga sp.]MBO9728350.1 N-acetyltransferase [Chitinophaga sp.]
MHIRQEQTKDHPNVFRLIQQAFEKEVHSDHREQFLVERLRHSDAFVPALSLVAEEDGNIVGYILLTKINIVNNDTRYPALALAPVAVLPGHQGKGIGGKLIKAAHEKAIAAGFTAVVVLGHAHYYPRFGYKMAKTFGIRLPFEVPEENSMVLELTAGALKEVTGVVEYATPFFE